MLSVLGILEGKRTNEEQMAVMLEAFDVFLERNEDRQDLWAEYDIGDAAMHIRSKAGRIAKVLERNNYEDKVKIKDKDIDEALDLMMYCAFFVRHAWGWLGEERGLHGV